MWECCQRWNNKDMSLVSQESNLQSDSSTRDEKSGFECGLPWQKLSLWVWHRSFHPIGQTETQITVSHKYMYYKSFILLAIYKLQVSIYSALPFAFLLSFQAVQLDMNCIFYIFMFRSCHLHVQSWCVFWYISVLYIFCYIDCKKILCLHV